MTQSPAPLNRLTARRFLRAIRDLLTSEVRTNAIAMLVLLLLFALGVNALNVVNSFVGRDFMTSIAQKNMSQFVRLAAIYVGVFLVTTAVAVFYRFTEERLGLLWRSWLTKRVTDRYLQRRTFFRLKELALVENPDQRIADDIRSFTATTLSFLLIFLNGALAAISFSGVLWTISPLLFVVAVGYAILGSLTTIWLGRPLVGLNYRQSDREADFRAALIHVRENAESIAVLRREARLRSRLQRRIDETIANFRRITSVNRNLGFFTTGYNYLIQIIPMLIIAPQFIRGEVEFGVITQSAMAFSQLLGAFSLIINQFGSISTFAAVVARLGALAEAVEIADGEGSFIQTIENDRMIACENLTLRSQQHQAILLDSLTFTLGDGQSLLVSGGDGASALFRALAGVWPIGDGKITRPSLDTMLFLPERPYLSPGTLRDVLVRTEQEQSIANDDILTALREFGMESFIDQAGGFDVEYDWAGKLSLHEQQILALTRVLLARPPVAVMDHVSTTLSGREVRTALEQFRKAGITFVTFDNSDSLTDMHEVVLEIKDDGHWNWLPRRKYSR